MNVFTKKFLQKHRLSDAFALRSMEDGSASIDEMWENLLDALQDGQVSSSQRISWALWVISVSDHPQHILAELAWRFANDVVEWMPPGSLEVMRDLRRYLDGDQIDLVALKDRAWSAEEKAQTGAPREAARAARLAVQTAELVADNDGIWLIANAVRSAARAAETAAAAAGWTADDGTWQTARSAAEAAAASSAKRPAQLRQLQQLQIIREVALK